MKDSSLVFRINEQKVNISGGEANIYENNKGVFFSYQGSEIFVTNKISINTLGNRNFSIRITHRQPEECIEIDNNSENIRVTYMNKVADPGRKVRLSTRNLEDNIDKTPIKFAKRDSYGTKEGFRIYPLTQTEEKDGSAEQDDSLNSGELRNPYSSDSRKKSYKDIGELLKDSIYANRVVNGSQRTVYKVDASAVDMLDENGGSIVKVAHNEKGVRANRHEMQAWQSVKSTEYRKFFCPITSIGPSHKYVVMKEADMDGISHMGTSDFRKEVTNTLDVDNSVDNVSPMGDGWDIFSANVGMYEGRPVLVDYPYGGNIMPEF